ncbi:MAG: serine/threonine protein kinase [Cyanobacteria bacterium SZAS TMP-1]|nr:serine/threonine protein kinase [Cyanobacteria bacterium SZAS TMP-1]
MPASKPDGDSGSEKVCRTCGKRKADAARPGSLTGYLFQSFNCQCDIKSPRRVESAGKDSRDFCPKCGLMKVGAKNRGSLTEFLFQDIRCKCDAVDDPSESSMSLRFRSLKEKADSDDRSPSVFDMGATVSGNAANAVGLKKGAIIGGNYRIVDLIGRGGMGEVYRARHEALNKSCALKVIPPYQVSEEAWQRFKQEARVISRLSHKNIVQVSDLGIHADCLPYYAMEFVKGSSLAGILADQKYLGLQRTLDIFIQVCDGLEYAHKSGVIHRDLKPANIMLADGEKDKPIVKILDFGLAKLAHWDRNKQSLTMVGDIFGSPFYMSPEQCAGEAVDQRSDIYSVGCTLFECLAGRPPFIGNLSASIIYAQQEAPPPTVADIRGEGIVPESMEIILAKLLRKDPAERYQSMGELRLDLEKVQRGETVRPYYLGRSGAADRVRKEKPDDTAGSVGLAGQKNLVIGILACALLAAGVACYFLTPRPVPVLRAPARDKEVAAIHSAPPSAPQSPPTAAESKVTVGAEAPNTTTTTPQKMLDAWVVELSSDQGGHYRAVIASDKANYSNDSATYTIGSPDYDRMVVVSDPYKSYVVLSLKQWFSDNFARSPIVIDKFAPVSPMEVSGLPCNRYEVTGHMGPDPRVKMRGQFWTTDAVSKDPELIRASCLWSGSPMDHGLPVRYTYTLYTESHCKEKILDKHNRCFITSAKKVTVPAAIFDVPPSGYKKMKSHLDLYTQDFADTIGN